MIWSAVARHRFHCESWLRNEYNDGAIHQESESGGWLLRYFDLVCLAFSESGVEPPHSKNAIILPMATFTPKQRMLNAYRGLANDRPAVAPEFWYYFPAKLLGLDMIEFNRYPFHLALKQTFERYNCEGWGIAFAGKSPADIEREGEEQWLDEYQVAHRTTAVTPYGPLTSSSIADRREPGWVTERWIKDVERDLPAYEYMTLGADPAGIDFGQAIKAWEEVGEAYLLEFYLGEGFFDYFATACEGGLEAATYHFFEYETELERLHEHFTDFMVRKTRAVCERTPFESLFIGCAWSCLSLISPAMWRKWDKPVLTAICDEAHRHGRLVHLHNHGKCLELAADFPEIGIDCVCPFERPPGGDVEGLAGLQQVAERLAGRTTMNGNIHTVETLIRGTEEDVRREVREVLKAFDGNPRVIVGTGDQVGRETPEENIRAMIEEAKG